LETWLKKIAHQLFTFITPIHFIHHHLDCEKRKSGVNVRCDDDDVYDGGHDDLVVGLFRLPNVIPLVLVTVLVIVIVGLI
jgi:hypothetical protein